MCKLKTLDLQKDFSKTHFDWAFNFRNHQVEANFI